MSNLTQHQKDDYLLYLKGLSNKNLIKELELIIKLQTSSEFELYTLNDINLNLYCYKSVWNELKLRLVDWLDK